jgi:ABC-type nickel/cobalt efflux system permease component RcnA
MALFEWTLDLDPAYFPMLNDVVRMGVIQLVVQFLFFAVNPAENPFFSTMFLQTIGFVVVGVLVYWMLVRHVFVFRSAQSAVLPASGLPYVETFSDGEHQHQVYDHHHKKDRHHHFVAGEGEGEEEMEETEEEELLAGGEDEAEAEAEASLVEEGGGN